MKKIYLSLSLFFSAALSLSAESLTQLEGSFKTGPAIILIAILVIFVLVGIFFRAKDPADYYAAGRKISTVGSGMAIASNWMSAASILGMAGMMYGFGYNGLAYVVGWTGGYVLLLILMAAQIRKYGKYTAPDFIGDRYYSRDLRIVSAIFTILISFTYCVGQFGGIGLMFKWILGLDYAWAVIIGSSVVLLYTLISGMIGATKNMQIQYVIIVSSFLIPVFIMAFKFDYFWLLPQIGYGAAVTDIVQGIPAPNIADGVAMINAYGHDLAIVPSPEFAMPWDPSTGTTAACTIFPLFLLGIWWSGSNRAGAKAGLFAGFLITTISITYFIVGLSGGSLPGQAFISYWLNVWYFAWIGAPLAIIVNIIVSLLTSPTPLEIKKFLAEQVHN